MSPQRRSKQSCITKRAADRNRTSFSEGALQVPDRNRERCSMSLIREMQIRTAVTSPHTRQDGWDRNDRKGRALLRSEPLTCRWRIELPYDPAATPVLRFDPKKRKTLTHKAVRTPEPPAASFAATQTRKPPKRPRLDGRTEKTRVCAQGVALATKKKEVLPLASTRMDPEGTTLRERSQRKTNTG